MPKFNGLYVPPAVAREVNAIQAEHAPNYPPTHPHAGMDSERAYVGKPGHCEACATVGHVVAHPDFGCGDVHCNIDH
jgi:hypothetical protein